MSANIIRVPYPAAGGGGAGELELVLDAGQETGFSNGQEMSAVQDWSGNGRHGTGVINNVLKPTYRATDGPSGLPAFRMSNISTLEGGYFTLPDFLTGFTAGHIFVVVKLDIEPLINSRAGPPIGDWGTGIGEFYGFPADGIIYDGFGSNTRKTTVDPAPALTDWHLYEARSESGAWSNYLDGVLLHGPVANTVAWGTGPKIGGRITSGTAALYGLINRVIFYSRILDAGEVQTIYDDTENDTGIVLP